MRRNLATEVTTETERPGRPTLVEDPESQRPERPKELKDQIRFRAYEIYQQRGMVDGAELDDWLQAEEEVAGELRAKG
jgi:hypothetical protein